MDCNKVNSNNIVEYVKKNIKYMDCVDLSIIDEETMFELFSVNLNVYSYFKAFLTPLQLEKLVKQFPFLIEHIYMPNKDLIKKAVKSDPNVLSVLFDNKFIKLSDDDIYELIKHDVSLLKFIPKKAQNIDLIKKICMINVDAYKYSNYYIEEIEDYIVENYPEKFELLKVIKEEYYTKLVYYEHSFFFNIMDKNLIDEIDYEKLFGKFPNVLRYIYDKIDDKYWIHAIKNDVTLLEVLPYNEKIIKEVLKYNGFAIKYLKNKTINDVLNAIKNNVLVLDYIDKKRNSLIDFAYKLDSIAIKYKNVYEMSFDELMDAIERNYEAIKYIPDDLQTEDMQMMVIEQSNGTIISYIKPKNENVVKYLLNFVPAYILSVANPTKDMYLIAFSKQPSLILKYNDFENFFDEEILKSVLFHDPMLIQYFSDPTKEMMLIAVENNPLALKYLTYQDYDIIYTALMKDPNVIKYVDRSKLTDDIIEMLYEKFPEYFDFEINKIN